MAIPESGKQARHVSERRGKFPTAASRNGDEYSGKKAEKAHLSAVARIICAGECAQECPVPGPCYRSLNIPSCPLRNTFHSYCDDNTMSMFILAILLVQAVTIAPVRASAQEDFPELDYWLLSVTGPYPGAMQTGAPPFLAQTDPIPGPTGTTSFVPNEPLQTAMAIPNNPDDINIFEYMGNLSPYFVPPGFGVDEYSLPSVCEITQVNVLSRHGSRYPDAASSMMDFATGWQNISTWTGDLAYTPLNDVLIDRRFLNNWTYALGVEDLVPKGRQE